MAKVWFPRHNELCEEHGVQTLLIEPGSPWKDGCCEKLEGRPRNDLLGGNIFYSLKQAKIVIEQWRRHCNAVWPETALGNRLPPVEVRVSVDHRPTVHQTLSRPSDGCC